MSQWKEIFIKKPFDYLKVVFFDGLLIVLPIAFTLALFNFMFKTIKGWLSPIYRIEPSSFKQFPHSEIILVIIFIFCTGIIFRTFFLKPLLVFIDTIFAKIPLFNQVYSGIKQLIQAFTVSEKLTFQQVVLVEFPRKQMYSIGFLTKPIPSSLVPDNERTYFGVFVPTTPNPTTGFLIMVRDDEYKTLNISRQEAMSMIISGGIIQPK